MFIHLHRITLPQRLSLVSWGLFLLAVAVVGCTEGDPSGYGAGGYSYAPYDMVPEFKDDAVANAKPLENFEELTFQSIQGEKVDLKQYLGKKNVVLVITRGLTGTIASPDQPNGAGTICTFCATQTSRLAANYAEFAKRDAEVVVVFPVVKSEQSSRANDFEKEAQIAGKNNNDLPFPLVLDVELRAVDALGIRKDLSKPATYILDREGMVRYAYVGETLIDRPSAKALLDQLDEINQGEK